MTTFAPDPILERFRQIRGQSPAAPQEPVDPVLQRFREIKARQTPADEPPHEGENQSPAGFAGMGDRRMVEDRPASPEGERLMAARAPLPGAPRPGMSGAEQYGAPLGPNPTPHGTMFELTPEEAHIGQVKRAMETAGAGAQRASLEQQAQAAGRGGRIALAAGGALESGWAGLKDAWSGDKYVRGDLGTEPIPREGPSDASKGAIQAGEVASEDDKVASVVGMIARMPPDLVTPSSLVTMFATGGPVGGILRSGAVKSVLGAIERKFGTLMAKAVQTELSGAAHVGAFSGGHAALEGRSPGEIVQATGEGALTGAILAPIGAAAGKAAGWFRDKPSPAPESSPAHARDIPPTPEPQRAAVEPLAQPEQRVPDGKGEVQAPKPTEPVSVGTESPSSPPRGNLADRGPLHSENAPDKAARMLDPRAGGLGVNDQVWLATNPDLATGQGANRGVRIEFDPAGLSGEVSTSKPGAEFQAAQGNAEIIGSNRAEAYQDAARKVTIDRKNIPPEQRPFAVKLARTLQEQGWAKSDGPDGSLVFTKGEASGKVNGAAELPVRDRPQEKPAETGGTEVPAARAEEGGPPAAGEVKPAVEPAPERIPTSARKAMMEEDRTAMGLDALDSPERRSWQQTIDDAQAQGVPDKAMRIAGEVNQKPRALSDTETAGLVVQATKLKNQHRAIMEEVGKATDPADIALKSAEAGRIEEEFGTLSKALRSSGTEKGRALASQKLTLDQDFSLLVIKNRAKAAKGKALTPAESAHLERLTTELEAANTKVAGLEKKMAEQVAERAVRRHAAGRRAVTHDVRAAEFGELLDKVKHLLKEGCR